MEKKKNGKEQKKEKGRKGVEKNQEEEAHTNTKS